MNPDIVYPDDWPCLCGHLLENHGVIDVDEGGYDDVNEVWDGWVHQVWICSACNNNECVYIPVDNLTIIENLAAQKSLE